MNRALEARLTKLELLAGGRDSIPNVICAIAPIPLRDLPTTPEVIQRWLKEGSARVGFKGHAVVYRGLGKARTADEWVARYAQKH